MLLFLGLGIAAAGYFIGEGLKNFKNPKGKNVFEKLDEEEDTLINENIVHNYIGVSKEDAKLLVKEHQDIPHIIVNGTVYFPKNKLREWINRIGN